MEAVTTHWKSLRNGVIVSVVMLYLVEPSMKLLVNTLPYFGGRAYRWVWDHAAAQAALGGDYIDFALFAILFSAIVGAFIGRYGAGGQVFTRKRRSSDTAWSRWERRLVMLALLLFGPVAATTLLVDFAAQQMKLSFEQRMAVLAPSITEEEEEMLRGRFAGLDGRDSYENLKLDMSMAAHQHGVSLPEPLL
ncbi:MAG TPA: hypothetical protein VN852_07780 [Candidatus Krumholzibacteria bacterium]|nr:hypothetical protein [Candidatus Krumholzibacteria bacterium]